MTFLPKPKLHHPDLPTNALGFTRRDYEGAVSTLCAGCGHDSISAAIVQRLLRTRPAAAPHRQAVGHRLLVEDADVFPRRLARLQLRARADAVSVLTGANLANRDLIYLGVSGDGDSASIGLGQFAHAMRRGVNMVYIVENNGVYGLTKGQFSATSDTRREEQARRRQHRRGDRPGRHGAAARRDLRRAQLLRRQGAARAADQGGAAAQGRGLHRLHLALRAVQQPCRLDQELRLRARAQRGGELPGRHHRPRGDHRRLRARHGGDGRAARRLAAAAAQAGRRLRPARPRRGDGLPAERAAPPARSSPACCMSIPSRATCTTT